jgi:serine protease Do
VRVGEWVLAVGNPFNLTSTVTAGIVSAKGRGIGIIGSENRNQENPAGEDNEPVSQRYNTGIESFIQTDAAINPGNSGGALVNTKGELIGINSAIASHTGSYEGYGFAIPINLAKKVVGDIEKYGTVKRGYVGVSFRELNQDAAQDLHIQATTGLYVNSVIPGSGAALAGIQNGDIITKVDGKPVYESSDLLEPVGRLQPGDKIDLTVMRGSQQENFPVTLEATEGNLNRTASYSTSNPELFDRLGASFQPLTQAQKDKLQVNSGVKVTGVIQGRLFDSLQIPEGSVIVSINKQDVNSVEDIRKAIIDNQNGRLVIKGYDPDGTPFNNLFEQNDNNNQ